jgi:tRNA pseudouridine65 synthase
MRFRILHHDERLVAIDKPPGFHVHPPEDQRHRIPRGANCLFLLRKQIGSYLYPVHRLDGATSGVLLFALDAEAASKVQAQFRERTVSKRYVALVRGWTETEGEQQIDSPLSGMESATSYTTLARVELPFAVGRYPSARYSLVEAHPKTGRMHQIRRHFSHIRHPLVGDSTYGDGAHNRFLKEKIPGSGLFLKAYSLEIDHPSSNTRLKIRSPWAGSWHSLFDMLGVCPRV